MQATPAAGVSAKLLTVRAPIPVISVVRAVASISVIAPVAPSMTSNRPFAAALADMLLSSIQRFQMMEPEMVTSASSGAEYQTIGVVPNSRKVVPAVEVTDATVLAAAAVVLSARLSQPDALPPTLASLLPVP